MISKLICQAHLQFELNPAKIQKLQKEPALMTTICKRLSALSGLSTTACQDGKCYAYF
jgi:hypothetical protein